MTARDKRVIAVPLPQGTHIKAASTHAIDRRKLTTAPPVTVTPRIWPLPQFGPAMAIIVVPTSACLLYLDFGGVSAKSFAVDTYDRSDHNDPCYQPSTGSAPSAPQTAPPTPTTLR